MDEKERKALMMDFEKNRQTLGNILNQKQQLNVQLEVIAASMEELEATDEKTVMKIIGNIMVNKSTEEMKKELTEQKESFELRLKTVEKQEQSLMKKLNSLKAEIEGSEKGAGEEKQQENQTKK